MPINPKHALILDGSRNHFFCCGVNHAGQLGTGDQISIEKFTKVDLPVPFSSLSAGENHSLGISELDGALWSWGSNSHGQLGQGRKVEFLKEPTKIPNTQSFVQVSAGNLFSLALDSNGDVWSFGFSGKGRLGLGKGKGNQFTPERIDTLNDIKSISAGNCHGIALDNSGIVWSFGSNQFGQLGVGNSKDRAEPSKIEGVQDIVQISSGHSHNLLLDSSGRVWSFGSNILGELGNSDNPTKRIVPELIPNVENIIQVFAAGSSSIIINNDHKVFVFGHNDCAKLGFENDALCFVSPTEQENWRNTTIFPGAYHTVIVDELGNLFFCGYMDLVDVQAGQQEGIFVEQRNNQPLMKRALDN